MTSPAVRGEHPVLGPGDVHVWRARLGADQQPEASVLPHLNAAEREHVARFRRASDRRLYGLARGLLRELLGAYTRCHPGDVVLTTDPHGKPRLGQGTASAHLAFNVSHAGAQVVIALTPGRRIGVDLECLDRSTDSLAIADRFFAPPECALLAAADAALRPRLFLRIWVLKEALLKGLGSGIGGVPLGDFAVTPQGGGEAGLVALTDAARAALIGWTIAEIPPLGPYVAALAIEGHATSVQLFDWPGAADRSV